MLMAAHSYLGHATCPQGNVLNRLYGRADRDGGGGGGRGGGSGGGGGGEGGIARMCKVREVRMNGFRSRQSESGQGRCHGGEKKEKRVGRLLCSKRTGELRGRLEPEVMPMVGKSRGLGNEWIFVPHFGTGISESGVVVGGVEATDRGNGEGEKEEDKRKELSGEEVKDEHGENKDVEDETRGLYTPYVEYCIDTIKARFGTRDYDIKERWKMLKGKVEDGGDAKAVCRSTAFEGEKIRMMRAADISAGPSLQVLNLVIFPRPEYDFPYFCADLVTFPKGHLIVIDLDPLYQTPEYYQKYIARMMPICHQYCEVLPWGGEMTSESLQFFSQSLIWARLPLSADVSETSLVFRAFQDYLQEWMAMVEECEEETDEERIRSNKEAQHRYICWRLEKDPGRPVLTRLFGAEKCEDYLDGFLFAGRTGLGEKGFLDYFPQYRMPDGSISKKRSMVGRSYPKRPWDGNGLLIP